MNKSDDQLAVPAPVVEALDRLNCHARGREGRYWGTERHAIYAYKTLAVHLLAHQGQVAAKFVRWKGKCISCGGTGRYTLDYWYDGKKHHEDTVRCRNCSGTGTRTLRFTVTDLPGGYVWHHPWEGQTGPGLGIARAVWGTLNSDETEYDRYELADGTPLEWHEPGEWQPQLPGIELPVEDLASLLNLVEDWVDGLPQPSWGSPVRWPLVDARRFLRQQAHRNVTGPPCARYHLELGREPGGCFECGSREDLKQYGIGRFTALLHWSLNVCRAHEHCRDDKAPPPPALLTPAVGRWLARHEQIESVG